MKVLSFAVLSLATEAFTVVHESARPETRQWSNTPDTHGALDPYTYFHMHRRKGMFVSWKRATARIQTTRLFNSKHDEFTEEALFYDEKGTMLNESSLLDTLSDDALSTQVSYFYLQKELGLSEESMWKITIDAPSALGMTAANIRAKVECLKTAMALSPEDIRDLLDRQPTLLHFSVENNFEPKFQWMKETLKMTKKQLRQFILSQPSILTNSLSNLQNKFRFFTSIKGLGFSVAQLRALSLQEPRWWTCSVHSGLLPRARFFLNELEIPKDTFRKIIQKNPRVLLYSLHDNLIPKLIHYAIMTLHMDPATHLTKLLLSYPEILDYNLERHIQPITEYFLADLQVAAYEFRSQILLKHPRVITYSLRKIKHNVGNLRYGLELDAAEVKRILFQAPCVLGCRVEENLAKKIDFLQQELRQYGSEEDAKQWVRKIVLGLPSVLNLSVEDNLKPKLEYLQSMLERNSDYQVAQDEGEAIPSRLWSAIVKKPALLGYSLETRLKPRLELIVAAGLSPMTITTAVSMTEGDFQSWLSNQSRKKAKNAVFLQRSKGTNSEPMESNASESANERSGRIVHWTRET